MHGDCYLTCVPPHGRARKEETQMTASPLRHMIDRVAPLCLTTLMFGLVVTFAAMGLAGA